MDLTPGSHVIHPAHGTTTVVERTTRVVGGEEREYVVLQHVDQDLQLMLPVEQLADVDLRPALAEDDVKKVLDVLRMEGEGLDVSWRSLRARNESKLNSGEATKIAEVVRDLEDKRREKGRLSPSETRMLNDARTRLVNELSLVIDGDVEQRLDEVLAA